MTRQNLINVAGAVGGGALLFLAFYLFALLGLGLQP